MRICRLNRIKIKDPKMWDKAKYDDFVGNQFSDTLVETPQEEKMLTINEEVTIIEFASKKF